MECKEEVYKYCIFIETSYGESSTVLFHVDGREGEVKKGLYCCKFSGTSR